MSEIANKLQKIETFFDEEILDAEWTQETLTDFAAMLEPASTYFSEKYARETADHWLCPFDRQELILDTVSAVILNIHRQRARPVHNWAGYLMKVMWVQFLRIAGWDSRSNKKKMDVVVLVLLGDLDWVTGELSSHNIPDAETFYLLKEQKILHWERVRKQIRQVFSEQDAILGFYCYENSVEPENLPLSESQMVQVRLAANMFDFYLRFNRHRYLGTA